MVTQLARQRHGVDAVWHCRWPISKLWPMMPVVASLEIRVVEQIPIVIVLLR
jgi:hypothetical protein